MCNAYNVGPSQNYDRGRWELLVQEAVAQLAKVYCLRPTDPGVVATEDGARQMRWGLSRPWSKAITCARDDSLESKWQESWQTRRCVIPMSAYFEHNGPRGQKQAHAFLDPADQILWALGIWEEESYSMVTTTPSQPVAPIHSRMPALIDSTQIDDYLNNDTPMSFVESREKLKTFPCVNPLLAGNAGPPVFQESQPELF